MPFTEHRYPIFTFVVLLKSYFSNSVAQIGCFTLNFQLSVFIESSNFAIFHKLEYPKSLPDVVPAR